MTPRSTNRRGDYLRLKPFFPGDSFFLVYFGKNGDIGRVEAANAIYCGGVLNIGSHLFDTIRMLTEKNVKAASGIRQGGGTADPEISGWISLDGGIPCSVISTGIRENLIFEIDIIGSAGRLRISENGEKVEVFLFMDSKRYSGYREPCPVPTGRRIARKDRFIEAVKDIIAVVEGKKPDVNCSGFDGLASLSISYAMLRSSQKGGRPVAPEAGDA